MTDTAAIQVQESLKALSYLVYKIEAERLRSASTLESITKAHENTNHDNSASVAECHQKLKNLYEMAMADAAQEEELLRSALSKIYEIRSICNEKRLHAKEVGNRVAKHRGALIKMVQVSALTLPLWVGKPGEKAPPLCGAIPADPNYVAKQGDMVAALVKVSDAENWILAEVDSYNPVTKKYDIDDIDEVHNSRHKVPRNKVVFLPLKRANPETNPEALFPKNSVVMALYPQTTCFYPAIVKKLPGTATDDYEVIFEDSGYPSGYAPPLKVSQRYVIDVKKKRP